MQIEHLLVAHLIVAHEHALAELLIEVGCVNHGQTSGLGRSRGRQIALVPHRLELRLAWLRVRVRQMDVGGARVLGKGGYMASHQGWSTH